MSQFSLISAGMPTKSKRDINAEITRKFIDAIENGVNPFQAPWSSAFGMPRNYRGNQYRGINFFLTLISCHMHSWDIPIYMTYKQAREEGHQVKKGSKGIHVSYASIGVPKEYKSDPESCPHEKRFFYRRLYTVFNVSQIDGIDLDQFKVTSHDFTPVERAEAIIEGYEGKPPITHEGVRAYYNYQEDTLTMPNIERFHSDAGYYEVLFHELAHSTGHSSRLDRKIQNRKGSDEYAFEELIAELTSSFLCADAGLLDATFDNSAAYLRSWLECLKNDTSFLIRASTRAQLAADHILRRSFTAIAQ